VLVTAASHRDRTDAVAAGLGAVAAEAGQRVVVVQSDGQSPERPALPTSSAGGLTTVTAPAQNGASLAATVLEVRREVASPDTFVVVAVPSPDSSPSAFLLGRTAKRAVVVATAGVTRVQDARRSAELLRYSGVEVAAAILQARRPSKGRR
jgi:Mrp family chromosome partitioning ATPase